jgi:hypothetical protein
MLILHHTNSKKTTHVEKRVFSQPFSAAWRQGIDVEDRKTTENLDKTLAD